MTLNTSTTSQTTAVINSKTELTFSYARFGLPLEKGQFQDANQLRLVDDDQQACNAIIKPRSCWPDNTLKWVDVEAYIQPQKSYYLEERPNIAQSQQKKEDSPSVFSELENGIWSVDEGLSFSVELGLGIEKKNALEPISSNIDSNPCRDTLKVQFKVMDHPRTLVLLNIVFAKLSGQIDVSVRIENQDSATHPNGQWDLGDPNSLSINNLSLVIQYPESTVQKLSVYDDSETNSQHQFSLNDFSLTQTSSGGNVKGSPIHVDANGSIPSYSHGFTLNGEQDVKIIGSRARPVVGFNSKGNSHWITFDSFWENFPSTLTGNSKRLTWQLFPGLTELQPGESKQWNAQVLPASLIRQGALPKYETTRTAINPDYLNRCNVFPNIHFAKSNAFDSLIKCGAEGEHSFLNKREKIDEFGWRHFGELYADHEALNQPKDDLFVSHYNNQYDTLLGTTIQHIVQPTLNWSAVSFPLAHHIKDIDIYNTVFDKPEYNGGLFWHTDHYLPAATCTHRTYSNAHTSVYEGHQGGGGPGGQHCYTTGLMMHALLFSDKIAEQKVLQLTHWIRNFYNGNNSLLGRLHRFLTIDLKPDQLTNIGIVKKGFRYPLDRGTGNFINSLLDSYELTSDRKLLQEAGTIIRETIGLSENLDERNLSDTENSWFYTVFLQSVIKYLLIKEQIAENDEDFAYAFTVFKNLVEWMANNEEPYLNHPEKLEFPNDTWAAQDLRKAVIFAYAGYFFPDTQKEYRQLSTYYIDYVHTKLSASPEATTTRILAILMQNYGAVEKSIQLGKCSMTPLVLPLKISRQSGTSGVMRLTKDLLRLMPKFSLKAEWQWLRNRLPNSILSKLERS